VKANPIWLTAKLAFSVVLGSELILFDNAVWCSVVMVWVLIVKLRAAEMIF
jgi:hypothetical protein